jgi:hypothetical protein
MPAARAFSAAALFTMPSCIQIALAFLTIAAQTNPTLLGKRLELLKIFFRASVGMDFRRRFPYDVLLSHLSLSLIKMG